MKKIIRIYCLVLIAGFTFFLSSARADDGVFVYDDHAKRDPFLQLVTPGGVIVNYDKNLELSDMVLEGVVTGKGEGNIAIINGMIVKVNDSIGLFVVKSIETDAVVLQKGEKTFILKLKKEE